MNGGYYVYKHTSPNGKVYIGITSQNPQKRWKYGHGYIDNHYFRNAIKKYGWNNFEHEILFSGLSVEEAKKKEIELIKEYDSTNRSKGYNRSPGGNSISEESREKCKATRILNGLNEKQSFESKRRWSDPEFRERTIANMQGKKRTAEQKEHYRLASTGRTHSEETRQKLREIGQNHTGELSPRSKAVYQIDIHTFQIIAEYVNARQAALQNNLSINAIATTCRSESGFCKGFLWCYKEKYSDELIRYWKTLEFEHYGLSKKGERASMYGKKLSQKSREAISIKRSVPVINLDTGEVFPSSKEAEEKYNNGKYTGAIGKCINGRSKTSFGYHWAHYTEQIS